MSARAIVAAVALTLAGTAPAQTGQEESGLPAPEGEPTERLYDLMVGDPAPALSVEEWVKGEPVTGFERGRVYVVEFWATWCGPCMASVPHLTELQRKHADDGVTVIGVTSADARGNTLEAVRETVAAKGDDMGYTVAWDRGRETNLAYMKAANKRGIPCTFVVDRQGRVAHIGHPMHLDGPLAGIVAGEWDIERAAAEYAAERALEQRAEALRREAVESQVRRDWDASYRAWTEVASLGPAYESALVDRGMMLLLGKRDYDAAYRELREAVEGLIRDDPWALNRVSWTILDEYGVERRDLALALEAAQRAVELTEGKEAAILDTLARAYWDRGDREQAVKAQARAVEATPPGPLRIHLETKLKRYRGE